MSSDRLVQMRDEFEKWADSNGFPIEKYPTNEIVGPIYKNRETDIAYLGAKFAQQALIDKLREPNVTVMLDVLQLINHPPAGCTGEGHTRRILSAIADHLSQE